MVRFLILLEIVLVGLLAVRLFDAGTELRTGAIANNSPGSPRPAGLARRSSYLPVEDRTQLNRDLLGSIATNEPLIPVALDAKPKPNDAELEPDAAVEPDDGAPVQPVKAPERGGVAEAQRLLARLGYTPGPVDGVFGERTQHALEAWQRRSGRPADAELDAALLAQLRKDARSMQAMVRARKAGAETRPHTALPDVGKDDGTAEPAWVATLAGGFQRLLGRKFDSRANPVAIRQYCSVNRETWIFDEGRRTFLWCGGYPARS